jgi:hypothetical protein
MRAKFKGFPTKRSAIELGKKMALSQDLAVSPEFRWLVSCVFINFKRWNGEINTFSEVVMK